MPWCSRDGSFENDTACHARMCEAYCALSCNDNEYHTMPDRKWKLKAKPSLTLA